MAVGVEGVACVTVGAETLMHRNRGVRPARELCWGASDEVFRRGRLSFGKPRHDVGEQKSEVAQVL